MVNMKLSASEAKAETLCSPEPSEQPRYPYGLTISLDDDVLEKLGMADTLPKVGATMRLTAIVEVTNVSQNETQGSEPCQGVGLQITDMSLDDAKGDADKLYDKREG